jgi:hypothetical protein
MCIVICLWNGCECLGTYGVVRRVECCVVYVCVQVKLVTEIRTGEPVMI